MSRKMLSVLIALVMVFAISGSCFAAPGYFFNGGVDSYNTNGCKADITVRDSIVTSGSSTRVYVSIGDTYTSGNWARVGYIKEYNWSSPQYFYEYAYNWNGYYYGNKVLLGNAPLHTTHNFKVGCDATTMYFIIDEVTKGTVALSLIPFARNSSKIHTEARNNLDRVPAYGNPIYVRNADTKVNVWGAGFAPYNVLNHNSEFLRDHSIYAANNIAYWNRYFDMWDTFY